MFNTVFDKAEAPTKGNARTRFDYGVGQGRYRRVDEQLTDGSWSAKRTTTYLGSVEYIEDHVQGESYFLRQIAGVALQRYYVNSGVRQTDFLVKDHLGSIHTVVQDNGTLERMHFGAFGERVSDVDWTTSLGAAIDLNEISTRGLTGHEHVDSLGIIHMNGRIYDPKLGRFLQADPFVQFPKNGQNLNRYSYVMNNPLSYTDPSGYFLDKLWDAIKPFIGIIVAAVIVIATGGTGGWVAAAWYNAAIVGAASGAASAAVNGGNILRGALLGGIAGAAGYGIGTLGLQGAEAFFANGALGGSIAELGGGNFGHGFLSAGVGSLGGGGDGFSWEGFLKSAITGGVVSEVTGGKFGNGAAGAAMSYAISGLSKRGFFKKGGQRSMVLDARSMAGEASPLFDGRVKVYQWGPLSESVSADALGSVKKGLETVFQTSAGGEILARLTTDQPLEIFLNTAGENAADIGGYAMTVDLSAVGKIHFWDVSKTPMMLVPASIERILTHEMGHAVMGTIDFPDNESVIFTDRVMSEINQTQRSQYRNVCVMNSDGICL